jgi:heme exporter protein D
MTYGYALDDIVLFSFLTTLALGALGYFLWLAPGVTLAYLLVWLTCFTIMRRVLR